jgi:hypothetical protein
MNDNDLIVLQDEVNKLFEPLEDGTASLDDVITIIIAAHKLLPQLKKASEYIKEQKTDVEQRTE